MIQFTLVSLESITNFALGFDILPVLVCLYVAPNVSSKAVQQGYWALLAVAVVLAQAVVGKRAWGWGKGTRVLAVRVSRSARLHVCVAVIRFLDSPTVTGLLGSLTFQSTAAWLTLPPPSTKQSSTLFTHHNLTDASWTPTTYPKNLPGSLQPCRNIYCFMCNLRLTFSLTFTWTQLLQHLMLTYSTTDCKLKNLYEPND